MNKSVGFDNTSSRVINSVTLDHNILLCKLALYGVRGIAIAN